MRFFLLVWGLTVAFALAKPMESIERYNVILVHGAADSLSGMDCSAADLKSAYSYYDIAADTLKRIDGYYHISWDPKWKDPTHKDTSRSTAAGMMKTLYMWMAEDLFDGNPSPVYLNRPFKNPANTPVVNGGEIGNRTWKGADKCSVRRSLTEEAEEVRNKGKDSLKIRRKNSEMYKTYSTKTGYSTHRNILIAHNMGGGASHEYVTDGTLYTECFVGKHRK